MTYTSYNKLMEDLDYIQKINENEPKWHRYNDDSVYASIINDTAIKRIRLEYTAHIKEKFEATKKSNTSLGKFLQKYPLEFKEFCCLLKLIKEGKGQVSMFTDDEDDECENPFVEYHVRYESSQLKRYKLVYRIVNLLRPLKVIYEISYKAQLALKNKKYTNEYEQLDIAFEEESKRNSPDELDSLYYVIEPKVDLNDLIVPDKTIESLKSAIARDKEKDKIFKRWGFKNVIEYGRGTTLNFRGPPGTGKTLAANCLAKELGKKLLMVRYDQIQSMWVGQTEKHIQRIFNLAGKKNAVLFFDEADAIALNRASLERSWEMSQVNTLLKELERFEGVCVFATNFAKKYDPAFERRLTMHIDFVLPDLIQCHKIMDNLIPKKSREKGFLLENLKLEGFSGGDLKNIALNAAGIAAKRKAEKISIKDVEEAIALTNDSKKSSYKTSYLG